MNSFARYFTLGIAAIAVAGAFFLGRGCGSSSAQNQITDLTKKLTADEQTIQISQGLYATQVSELTDLQGLLAGDNAAVKALKEQLTKTNEQLLSTEQVVVQWKNAYDEELQANQTVVGKRERVDFRGKLGPIAANGYTMTNPPEAHLSLRQVDPLTLTVSVARAHDGSWTAYTTSSDPNIDVHVKLAGVDPGVVSPTWKQRIWLDSGVDFLGGKSFSLGMSYRFDRWSLGFSCSVWNPTDFGCGVSAGFRIFK